MRARALHSAAASIVLAITALAACSDDAESAAKPATDSGVASDASNEADSAEITLPAYIVPGSESMAAITIDETSGAFFVDSAESGKIYRGVAGADKESTLELFADLTSAGIARGGHIALSPDGGTLFMLSAFGEDAHVSIVDVATKTVEKTVAMPAEGSGLTLLQDVAVSPDGKKIYATNSLSNVIHTVDLSTYEASTFPISSEFPHIAETSRGFINATGLAISKDGKYLLVVHIIDKHIYRVSLDPATLGKAQVIDTTPYNVSGNGLWLGKDGDALEVAGDELRVFRFGMNADSSKGELRAKYQSDFFEQGLTYAVGHADRVLVLNGSGVSLGGGGGGFPDGGIPEGGIPEGGIPEGGFGSGGDAGTKKLPIKVLQLPR